MQKNLDVKPLFVVAAIIIFYKNMKVKFRSPDGDTDNVIVAGVLPGDTLRTYFFIICLDYVLRTSINLMKENGFTLKKKVKKQTIPCTKYYGLRLS